MWLWPPIPGPASILHPASSRCSRAKGLDTQRLANASALYGIGPKDEFEGMLAAQLLASSTPDAVASTTVQ